MGSQTTREHKNSFQPSCSWNEFKQTAKFTGIETVNQLRWSIEVVSNWHSLCRNLDMSEAAMNRIANERYTEQQKKDECLTAYFNSNEAYWEEVIIAVLRSPFGDKRLAATIAEKYLKHSPIKDTILTMIKKCDTITITITPGIHS